MIVHMSDEIIVRSRPRLWPLPIRWVAMILKDDLWHVLFGPLGSDDMLRALIEQRFPLYDIEVFIQAINDPSKTPFNKYARKPSR